MSVNEQWDIVSGVGITALAVAAVRAIETERADGLVDDPYAAALVEAANSPLSAALHSAERASILTQAATYVGVRSRFFDSWFEQACSDGVRQAVILASGLDTRPLRLAWPPEMRVFEIDQPKVLEYKESVLRGTGVPASCDHHAIGVDLREDWAGALKDAGFDTGLPTAWLAEGLLPYLPAAAEEDLLTAVHGFSAPGSRIAIESIGGVRSLLTDSPLLSEASEDWGIDLAAMMPDEERPDPADRLTARRWTVTGETLDEVATRYRRSLDGFAAHFGEDGRMLTARLPA